MLTPAFIKMYGFRWFFFFFSGRLSSRQKKNTFVGNKYDAVHGQKKKKTLWSEQTQKTETGMGPTS